MKNLVLLIVFIALGNTATAQFSFSKNRNISIGYFGHYVFHPGVKVGTQFNWKEWEKTKEKRKKTITKEKSLFIRPQIGFYTHPNNHSGLMFNADFGYQRLKPKHGLYWAYSLGLGYQQHFNAGTTYVSENGKIVEKSLGSRGYFLPTISVEFGQRINSKIGWYSKFSVGSKIKYNTGISVENFLELGVKISLNE